MIYDYIVIGSGYGGLSAAALLAQKQAKTLILESHLAVGGCASFFKRKDFLFDVGATTLSGVLDHQPIGKLIKQLDLQLKIKKIDPGIIFKYQDKTIKRYADNKKWSLELADKFKLDPKPVCAMFQELNLIEQRAWELLDTNTNMMPANLLDYIKLVKNIASIDMLPKLFVSFEHLLKKYRITDPDFIKLLDNILLISTQNTHQKVPILSAALGLGYPAEVYYPYGGMVSLAQEIQSSFESQGGEIKFKSKVVSIHKEGEIYELQTEKGEIYKAYNVVSNIPIWNMAEITNGKVQDYFQNLSVKFKDAWGAFTSYFVVKDSAELDSLYYQIYGDFPYCDSDSIFVSFSSLDDRVRAPEGYRTVTISVHTSADFWASLCAEEYQKKKQELASKIEEVFLGAFPGLEGSLDYSLSASPKTFEFFTSRHKGLVGGIPHSTKHALPFMPNQVSPFKGLYTVGDTSFPGQGVATVIYSAQSLMEKI